MPQRLEGVVLDLDGTLIDSAPDLHAAANTLLAEHGRELLTLEAVRAMIGDGMPALVARAFAATGRPADAGELPRLARRFAELYQDPRFAHLTRVYPGVSETLAALRREGLRLAVCTNKMEQAALGVLAQLGLAPLLDAVVGGDRAPAQKPDPAHVRAALDRISVPAQCAAMVGDGPNDVAAARAAGIPVVAVSYGYSRGPASALGADLLIDRFADLPLALGQLGALPVRP